MQASSVATVLSCSHCFGHWSGERAASLGSIEHVTEVHSISAMRRNLSALHGKGYAGSRSITDCLGKQVCRGSMAPHVCKVRHCIHVSAGLGPVNACRNVRNATDAEIINDMVITIAQDDHEHSSNQFSVSPSTSRKSEALSRSNLVPLLCTAVHCRACLLPCRIGPSPCMSFPYGHRHNRSSFIGKLPHKHTS